MLYWYCLGWARVAEETHTRWNHGNHVHGCGVLVMLLVQSQRLACCATTNHVLRRSNVFHRGPLELQAMVAVAMPACLCVVVIAVGHCMERERVERK